MSKPLRSLLAATLVLSTLPLRGQDKKAVDGLLDRIVQHEQEFLKNLRAHSPIIETYIQETPAPDQADTLPTKDHYFLGRMSLASEVNYESFLTRTDHQKGSRLPFAKAQTTAFLPKGFAQMTVLDASNFNRHTYTFDYVRREFLGEVRCLVFDVAPIDKSIGGQFFGSIWVEDKDYRIVRFNGTYTAGKPASRFSPRQRPFVLSFRQLAPERRARPVGSGVCLRGRIRRRPEGLDRSALQGADPAMGLQRRQQQSHGRADQHPHRR